jgi:hypothetical protein
MTIPFLSPATLRRHSGPAADVQTQHLLTYPAVQDSVRAFRENALGRLSIQLSNSAYQMVVRPVASLLNKPYGLVAPYVQRADQLGDQTLSTLEKKFPVVKKPSPELLSDARQAVYAPVRHVSEVYNGTYQQAPGGYTASGMAAVKTAAVLTGEGVVFTLRSLVKLGESLKIGESHNARADSIEAAIGNHGTSGQKKQGTSGGTKKTDLKAAST